MSPTNLTRRSFMKASALAAGAAALGSGVATVNNLVESDQAYAADEVKLVHTSCRACISNCGIIAHVQNGRVIKLEGDPADPHVRGPSVPQGPLGHSGAVSPQPQQVPHEARGRTWRQPVGAHQLGGSHRHHRRRAHGHEGQNRPRRSPLLHGRRRQPAVLQPAAFPQLLGRGQRVRAGLRAVLPAAQLHHAADQRRK